MAGHQIGTWMGLGFIVNREAVGRHDADRAPAAHHVYGSQQRKHAYSAARHHAIDRQIQAALDKLPKSNTYRNVVEVKRDALGVAK